MNQGHHREEVETPRIKMHRNLQEKAANWGGRNKKGYGKTYPDTGCQSYTLPETNIAPENGWLEYDMSFWDDLFSGASC